MSLVDLKPGQRGVVSDLTGGWAMRRRLASMGLTIGADVESIISRGRGPVVVAVRQTRLALGRVIARKVMVDFKEDGSGES